MENRKPIVEELQELGSSLAEFPAALPYQPVAGYFERFPDLMLQLIREKGFELDQEKDQQLVQEHDITPALSQLKSPFSVPDGYFDGLAGSIMNKLKNSVDSAFLAPKEFSEREQETAELSPLLAGISKKMPYSVPDQYFGKLAEELSAGLNNTPSTELREFSTDSNSPLSSELEKLKGINVFRVPAGYFDTLASDILSKINPQPAKVIRGNFGGRIIQYAAAAVIAGAMITAGFFLINRDPAGQQIVSAKGLEEKTAQTSDEDILRYLENQPAANFDVQPIIEDEIKDDAILDMLADVSDQELQQYVQYQSDEKQLFN